jgi:hypothetical protein
MRFSKAELLDNPFKVGSMILRKLEAIGSIRGREKLVPK